VVALRRWPVTALQHEGLRRIRVMKKAGPEARFVQHAALVIY
jgi:hypothetical protein